ncbi:MAG TPA: hypothetical protein VF543_04520 [Pyrinomonadaceae bacterium]|jgi:hypothetical protein
MSQSKVKPELSEKDALKKEVLADLNRQTLKKEIINELQKNDWKISLFDAIKHPIILLLVTFILTNWIATAWQSREWDRQQSRLVQIKGVEQKYEMMDEIIKAVGDNNSTIIELLGFFLRPPEKRSLSDMGELERKFQDARRQWNTTIATVDQKLQIYFKSPDVQPLFRAVTQKQGKIILNIASLHESFKSSNGAPDTDSFKSLIKDTFDLIRGSEELKKLIDAMKEEVRQDVEGRTSSAGKV